MTNSHPPGHPRAAGSSPDRQSNGVRSDSYTPPNQSDDDFFSDPELVTSPGHGAVAVFQAPQPVRPRGNPASPPVSAADDDLDIDSPFLDLFGGTPAPPWRPVEPQSRPEPAGDAATSAHDEAHSGTTSTSGASASGPASTEPPSSEPAPSEPAPSEPAPSRPGTPELGDDILELLDQWPADRTTAPAPGVTDPTSAARSGAAPGPDEQVPAAAQSSPSTAPTSGAPTSGAVQADGRPSAAGSVVEGAGRPADILDFDDTDGWPADCVPGGIQARAGRASAASRGPVESQGRDSGTWPMAAPVSPQARADDNRHQPSGSAGVVDLPLGPEPAPSRESDRRADLPATRPESAPARKGEAAPARKGETAPARRASVPARRGNGRSHGEPANLPAVREKHDKPMQLRPNKIKFSDRDPSIELEINEIAGHLTFTSSTVTAWYSLPEVRWAFRPDAEREALLSAISEQYAGLAGFRLHMRRTNRPFPADEWARTVDSHTPRPLPDVVGSTSWSDHLVAAQRHLLSVNHAEGQTYLGVTFARRSLGDTLSERVMRLFGKGVSDGERRKLGRTVEQFDEVLNAFGMRGRRVTSQELEWLLFRSVALCMAPPGPLSPVSNGQWERGDLLALTEQVERYRTPYGSTVKLVNRMTGEERHVAVLSVGRMEPLEIPEKHEPWMHFHERLPWPMELSSRVDILGSGDSFRNLEHRLRMIRSQQLDYAEHGIDAPPELERLAKRALVIGDDMTTGLPVESARAHGWHRIAVGGRTRDECLERARRLIQLYSRELRISLQHPKNQDHLAREFIPGEPIANTGYVRRMPVKLLAAALPQAASNVGDRRGDLIGRTAGTCRRPVFLDLHFPMEVRERSGLGVFVAEPGGGKSTLMGALGYLNARRGVQVTLLDPSGPLARLCSMPELRPYSRVLNLTGSEQGTLAPYALIPTPVRTEFITGPTGDREYEIAVSNARAERRMLVQDICSMLVPPQVAKEAATATLFRHAVRQVPAEETSTLDDIVACLQGLDDAGKELANLLLDTAEMPLALLFFGRPPAHLLSADSALTVITMAGLRLPDMKIEREYWSAEESLALPMLHTAHRLAVRRCYGGSMSSRKMVGLDEAHFMEGWRSGRSFLVRLARDSRKWNLAALVASQNPKDILGLDVQNLVSTVFVGRIAEDQEIASEALRLLRVPVHDGYEATLASLSQADTSSSNRLGFREFVMRDVDGRVQKVRVDVSYVDGLLEHLDTTPAAAAAGPATIQLSSSDLEA
jgi:hypothetical protein